MTRKVSPTSVSDLTSDQQNFILEMGVDPTDARAVARLAAEFEGRFHLKIPWKTCRRFITNLQRKERRSHGRIPRGASLPRIFVRPMSALVGAR